MLTKSERQKYVETYLCAECLHEWGLFLATWETPSCPKCGEHLTVTETTDIGGKG